MTKLKILCCVAFVVALACSPAWADLVGFYPLDGTTADLSGNGADPTQITAVGFVSGYEGQAGSFNGTSSLIRVPIDINPSVMPLLTMGAWVLPDNVSGIRGIISQDNGGFDRNLNIDYRNCASGNCYSAFTGYGVLAGTQATANPGDWVFVAASYSATADSVTLYVDDAVFSTTGALGSGLAFTEIGHNPSFSEWFSGGIDNVFVFDEVLSGAEISSIYRGGADAILALADDTPSPIPEPGSILLLGTGLGAIGLTVLRRRK